MIPLEKLEQGAWYYGHGRLGPVAKWDGTIFLGIDYSWGEHNIGYMEYDKGFAPYAVLDTSFTPDVLFQVDMAMRGRFPGAFPKEVSLQNRSVIEEFFQEFMEVGTYYLNVETQKELLKVALTRIAVKGDMSLEDVRKLARETLGEMHRMRFGKDAF
jgi:hypothetical protein